MKPAVLFDLGNTLAGYYHADEFKSILRQSISAVFEELSARGFETMPLNAALVTAQQENKEAVDFRFGPMADRFERIFQISLAGNPALAHRLCELFLEPIFAIANVYDDTHSVLETLSGEGYPLAIVSNAPWGSPPKLWRQEMQRLGLSGLVSSVVLCGDVGWRKPAAEIFEHAAKQLHRSTTECIFVGDDLRWDVAGSEAVGMRSVLIDRNRRHEDYAGERVENLNELLRVIRASA